MSIKTLRKRIALVAVSALGAGLMSVVVVPSANAAAFAASAVNLDESTDLASTVPGVCIAPTDTSDTAVVDYTRVTGGITVDVNGGTDDLAANEVATFTITGPAVWSAGATGATANGAVRSYSTDGKKAIYTADNDGSADGVVTADFRLTGAGTVVIKTSLTTAAGSTTVLDTLTVYSVVACDQGNYDATTSVVYLDDTNSTALTATTAAAVTSDDSTAAAKKYNETTYIKLWLTDKYYASISETGKYLTASATNGAYVGIDAAPSGPTAVTTTTPKDAVVYVGLPAGTVSPVNTTVTVQLNGVTVATRTINFSGQPAKIIVSGVASHIATSGTDSINFVVQDSAGTQLAGWTPVAGSTLVDVNGASVTAFTGASSATAVQTATLTAGAVEGESSTTIRVKLDDGTYVVSDPIKFFTSTASLATFTITSDKAVYAPGEVVTITVSGKNLKGNPVAATTALGGTVTWVGSGLTKVSADPAAADTPTGGAWTYKFYAAITEGNYGFSLATTSASVTTTAQTGTFQVKAQSVGVTNAEVLAAIVKLIASINKQIRALQKSLRR